MKFGKILTVAAMFAALSGSAFAKAKKSDSGKMKIVSTTFAQYDWTKEILGANADRAEITLLIGNGVDLHSYQPSIQDIAKISTADIFIFTGGESDGWVKDALKNARNKNMTVINMMESLGERVKTEEIKEGMQAEEEHEHEDEDEDHDHESEGHHHHDDDEEIEYDEHVWLSLRNAKYISGLICDAVISKDPANEAFYRANLASYSAKLDALDGRIAAAVKSGSKDTLLFGDRFPFRYFTDDYKLDYFAAFVGCSAETEASFETVIFLAKKVDELGLPTVLTIENSDGKIARTIVQNCKNKKAAILSMDSMQSVTKADIQKGETYLSIMEKNLGVLKEALK